MRFQMKVFASRVFLLYNVMLVRLTILFFFFQINFFLCYLCFVVWQVVCLVHLFVL